MTTVVLIGGGHAHAQVIKHFGMHPVPGLRLILIARDTHTPYSGMLPGLVAGHYRYDDVHIDLRRLCRFAGVRFYADEATGLDLEGQRVLCRARPPVPFDYCSINVGSAPGLADVAGAAQNGIPVKPISGFIAYWQELKKAVTAADRRYAIAVVGAGAAGVEITLAMQHALKANAASGPRENAAVSFHLFSATDDILPTHGAAVRKRLRRILRRRGIVLHLGQRVSAVEDTTLTTVEGRRYPFDAILWATPARAPAWLENTGLALTGEGFIKTGDTLQSVTDPRVFAVGDAATMLRYPREKAGVMAVRQGPPLIDNLRRILAGRPLKPFRPQARWLSLISTGDKYAVASGYGLAAEGRWVWHWKDWIDRRFMARFADLPAMDASSRPMSRSPHVEVEATETDMRCGGCGAKIGAPVLKRALARLKEAPPTPALILPHALDDAAPVELPAGHRLWQSVDFFRAFIDDPFVFGRITATHALGDLYAMGATPLSAQALAVVPFGDDREVEEDLYLMLAGAAETFAATGTALLGGHSAEGRELALGFVVNGALAAGRALGKGGLKEGDALLLTKPLGTGTLLAADMALAARGRWIDNALDCMARPAATAAKLLRAHGAHASTDITGFGLAGHVLEMADASGHSVELDLAALPVLDGALETLAAGITSTLAPANRQVITRLANTNVPEGDPRLPLLFDPQTAGGLVAALPADRARSCLQALHEAGETEARIVGTVREQTDAPRLYITI